MTPPRVLHVLDNLSPGGIQSGLLQLVEHTSGRFEHAICCLRPEGARRDRFEAAGASVVVAAKLEGQDWGLPWRLARLCRALRPQIVHTRNWGAIEGVPAARLSRVPMVIHGEHGHSHAAGGAADRRRARLRRFWLRFADRVVANADHLHRWLLHDLGVPAHKAVLIANGVDTDRFRPAADREPIRRRHGYQPGDVLVGGIGRLDPIKDYRTLVAAFEAVHRQQPAARLVIVGEGPEREPLATEIRRRALQQAARLAGQHDDVRDWLAMIDVFVQPSRMESTSHALLEAMSAGLPVVATRVGGIPELVRDGVTGRLVEAGDAGSLAAAVALYAHDPELRRRHGEAGREKAARDHPLARMIDAYVALYEQTRERHPGSGGAGAGPVS